MDAIETFLEAMFSPYPTTARLTEARSELRAMMEDAYNDAITQGKTHNEAVGQVITDFGNLEELAPVLGIAQDIRPDAPPQDAPAGPSRPTYPALTRPGSGERSSWSPDAERDEDEDPLIGFVASIYWPTTVIIYLLWSFIFNAWGTSWIIWPVAGAFFGLFASARTAWRKLH